MTEVFLKAPNDCWKIDKYNYKAMLDGYKKNDKIIRTSIYCQTKRLPDIFLVTPQKMNNDSERPPSKIGKELFDGKTGSQIRDIQYPPELRYICYIDTIYQLTKNSLDFWKEVCNNGLWDIWEPVAPYNTLPSDSNSDKNIYLYLLRLCLVDRIFKFRVDYTSPSDFKDELNKDLKVNIIEPILPNPEFLNIKNKLEDTLSKFDIKKDEIEIKDTLNMFKDNPQTKRGEKNMALYQLKSELKKDQKNIDEKFDNLKKEGKIDFITFHPSYSYEEFIEGITIKESSITQNSSPYTRKDGFFKSFCTRALYAARNPSIEKYAGVDSLWKDEYQKYKDNILPGKNKEEIQEWWNDTPKFLLIIDEINRGDISKIFGELITLLESDKRIGQKNELIVKLPYTSDEFGVPPNLYIIGTMNTADRSIALIDIALRRRFGFWEMPPEFDQLREDFEDFDENSLLGKSIKKLEDINIQIRNEETLGKEKEIGHSFFYAVDGKDDNAVISVWLNEIFPLLEEYYYGESDSLTALIKNEIYKDKRFTRNTEEIKRWIIGE